MSGKQAEAESNQLLHKLNLYEKRNQMAATLSGGMKRKLSLGIALIGNSKVSQFCFCFLYMLDINQNNQSLTYLYNSSQVKIK